MPSSDLDLRIDRDYLVDSLVDLVRINSVNPDLVASAPGEAEIGRYLAAALRRLDVATDFHELAPGRVNVIGTLKGAGNGRSLMLNAHMDTVGVEGMRDPFSAEVREGRLYGRGAQDMKGSIAAILAALKALQTSGSRLRGDLIVTFVADEEYGSIGTEHVVRHVKTDAAIVAEPTGLDICLAHKGFWVFELETTGRAAHGGCPEDGIDANMHMGRILSQLGILSSELRAAPPHPLVGAPSLHVPLMSGGDQLFIYSARCKMTVERRTVPGETAEDALGEVEAILAWLREADPQFRATVRPVLGREPYEISPEAEIVQVLTASASRTLSEKPEYVGHSWWEDSALIGERGTETAIIGPRGGGIHSSEEWVEIESAVQLAEILARTAVDYCGLAGD
ncbi:MAG: M20/M25/M40 family metallo-hydrolase [Gemmatimonadales bacterium]|jgi:acetylornithine deacetylase